jgi:hypothetical protein
MKTDMSDNEHSDSEHSDSEHSDSDHNANFDVDSVNDSQDEEVVNEMRYESLRNRDAGLRGYVEKMMTGHETISRLWRTRDRDEDNTTNHIAVAFDLIPPESTEDADEQMLRFQTYMREFMRTFQLLSILYTIGSFEESLRVIIIVPRPDVIPSKLQEFIVTLRQQVNTNFGDEVMTLYIDDVTTFGAGVEAVAEPVNENGMVVISTAV